MTKHSTSDQPTFWLIVAIVALYWLLANVVQVPHDVLTVARVIVSLAMVVLSVSLVRRHRKADGNADIPAVPVAPQTARKKFWQFVAIYELIVLPCGIVLAKLSGMFDGVPQAVQAFGYAVIAALSLIYFVQHRKPDGSIDLQ
jgi:uncharacterized membrane protein YesL